MGTATFLIGLLPTYNQIRLRRARPAADPAPVPGPRPCPASSRAPAPRASSTRRPTGARTSRASPSPEPRAATSWPRRDLHPDRGAADRCAAVVGLAGPVPAQRRGDGGGVVDPAHLAREPGVRGGEGTRRRAEGAAEGAVQLPAGRAEGHGRRDRLGQQHHLWHLHPDLRRQHHGTAAHHAVVARRSS